MKRILFTLLLAVVLWGGIVAEGALAADRNYTITNCNRKKLWEDVSSRIQVHKPELIEYLKENIKSDKERPQLSESDYKVIEEFDKSIQWHVSECILFMREANQLIDSIYKVNSENADNISWYFIDLFSRKDIPYIRLWNRNTEKRSFSFNFSPLEPEKIY